MEDGGVGISREERMRREAIRLREQRLKRSHPQKSQSAIATVVVRPPFIQQPKNDFCQQPNNSLLTSIRTEKPAALVGVTKRSVNVACSLISSTRFAADFRYNDTLIAFCRTLPTAGYNPQDKTWNFALTDYERFESGLKSHAELNVNCSPLPTFVHRMFLPSTSSPYPPVDSIDLSRIGESLQTKLFAFQRHGVRFCISRNGRALIADDMGVGKTLQALSVARYYADNWPLLIVCPSSVRLNWKKELLDNLQSVDEENLCLLEKSSDALPSQNRNKAVVICTYDILTTKQGVMKDYGFGVVILDESHSIKDFKAQRTKAAIAVTTRAQRVLLLSGTPALSRPAELYQQICVINKNLFPGGYLAFAKRYCDGKQGRFGFEAKGATNTTELDVILKATIMIRRMKNEAMGELPGKHRRMVVLDHSQIKESLKLLQDVRAMVERPEPGRDIRKAMLEYYRETAAAKAKAICAYIVDKLTQEGPTRKLLVFAHHQIVLDELSSAIAKARVRLIRIDGTTSSKRRQELCEQFQSNETAGTPQVALLSITAAGTGITLTAASIVIFAELFWNPGVLVQAEDRAYRFGQKENVDVEYLVAKGTADDLLWPLIKRKLDVLQSVGLNEENFHDTSTVINEDEIKDTPRTKTQTTLEAYLEQMSEEKVTLDEDPKESEPPAAKNVRYA